MAGGEGAGPGAVSGHGPATVLGTDSGEPIWVGGTGSIGREGKDGGDAKGKMGSSPPPGDKSPGATPLEM